MSRCHPAAYKTRQWKTYAKDFPAAIVARDQLEHAVPELSVHENGRIYKFVNDAVQAAVTGTQKPAGGAGGAQQQSDRVLQGLQIAAIKASDGGRRRPALNADDRSSRQIVKPPHAAEVAAWWNGVNAWLLLLPAAYFL